MNHGNKSFPLAALAAGAAWLCAGNAMAQQVTLYGLVDAAVERISNVNTATGAHSLTRMPSTTGTFPSRWGLRGSEDLGGGLKAVFTLESGFAPDTGVSGQGGRLFGRQAYVGLSGDWGLLSFGRQYTTMFWSLLDSDVIGPMVFGSGSLDSYLPNARIDNALSYRAKFFDSLSVAATFSTGRDTVNASSPAGTGCGGEVAGDSKACREWSAMVKYDRPTWGVATAIDKIYGGTGSWAPLGLTSSNLSDQRVTFNGYYKFGTLKLGGGIIKRQNDGAPATPRSDLVYFGFSTPVVGALSVDAQALQLKFKDSPNKAKLFIVRGNYDLSKRTTLYAAFGRIDNDGTLAISVSGGAGGSAPPAGTGQNGIVAGMRHTF